MNKIHLLNITKEKQNKKEATKKARERYKNVSDDEKQSLIGYRKNYFKKLKNASQLSGHIIFFITAVCCINIFLLPVKYIFMLLKFADTYFTLF